MLPLTRRGRWAKANAPRDRAAVIEGLQRPALHETGGHRRLHLRKSVVQPLEKRQFSSQRVDGKPRLPVQEDGNGILILDLFEEPRAVLICHERDVPAQTITFHDDVCEAEPMSRGLRKVQLDSHASTNAQSSEYGLLLRGPPEGAVINMAALFCMLWRDGRPSAKVTTRSCGVNRRRAPVTSRKPPEMHAQQA